MSDTDSIKTDRSQSDLQQKYDRLAMEFAKARMQLNVLKKAYTTKMSKLEHKSIESIDQIESCKYDTMSTLSFDFQENGNKSNQLKGTEELSSKDIQVLKQDIATMNNYICRVLELTQSNQLDYNLIMSEIEYCKGVQNNQSDGFCVIINNEFTTLKSSVLDCLYNILYHKLEARTKINTDDSRLIYPDLYFLDTNYKSDNERFQKVFITLVLHYFLTFILNLHEVLEYLLKEINPDASQIVQSSLKLLKNPQSNSHSSLLENILHYCEDLKAFKFDTQYIIMENILLFISNKYIESVKCIRGFLKSGDKMQTDCTLFRQNIISFMAIKFPVKELVNIESESWDSSYIHNKLHTVFDTIHRLLRVINIFEFEYLYKSSQLGIHWHKKNTLLPVKHTKQDTNKLFSMSVTQNKYDNIIQSFNEKLNQEMNKSLSLEQEKLYWENEYKFLCKKYDDIINKDDGSGSSGPFILENHMGKCEAGKHFNDKIMTREKELKYYFEQKMNKLISTNKYLSSQCNANELEITALETRLDHSILVRNELEMKLQNAMEHIDDLKEEFHLTSTNYDTQIRSLTEHLASLNETVMLDRRHIEDLNIQLNIKGGKNKPSK